MGRKIKKLLVANRGEIAVRIMRTCRDMGIATVAVFSDPDKDGLHVQRADEAFSLPGSRPSETYLNQSRILEIARQASVDAIHPGYGFLSENAGFAKAVRDGGTTFVGPSPEAITLLGDKTAARILARDLGIPTIPGSPGAHKDEQEALEYVRKTGFPVLLKAAAGGGGKGMRIVQSESEFSSAFRMATSEASGAFGDPRIYVERYLSHPHHIEIQVLGDNNGEAISLGERDCSIQRRHQKIIEESPSPFIDQALRSKMGEVAVALVKAARYSNAGTVEFLVDGEKNFYFLEVNTRLQVEHPVTEFVTGMDLVCEQITLAEGGPLSLRQDDVHCRGHALECRVYAEDTFNDFFPSTGVLETFNVPTGPRVRVDSGARAGDRVEVYYDPMLAKVITWDSERSGAVGAMRRALSEFWVSGVHTTIPFCLHILNHDSFLQGKHTTQLINQAFLAAYMKINRGNESLSIAAAISAAVIASNRGDSYPADGKDAASDQKWKRRRLDHHR